jgi:hypothetical protein
MHFFADPGPHGPSDANQLIGLALFVAMLGLGMR